MKYSILDVLKRSLIHFVLKILHILDGLVGRTEED